MIRLTVPAVLLSVSTLVGHGWAAAPEATNSPPSVTVYPMLTAPQHVPDELAYRMGVVVATLLERGGVQHLEVVKTVFAPQDTSDLQKFAEAFAQHVKDHPIDTQFAVLSKLNGSPAAGVKAIQTIIVDRRGKIISASVAEEDQLRQADPPPRDPMTCCVFIARHMPKSWSLADPLREDAPQGKMAAFWQKDAGLPDEQEQQAIEQRLAKLKKTIPSASCTIYPVNVSGQSDRHCTDQLVQQLRELPIGKLNVSEVDPELKIAGHSNEQKVLWDTARAVQKFTRQHPPTTDYVAYLNYGVFDQGVGFVHVVICDRAGDWVLVDLQNSHQPAFQKIAPQNAADCSRLVFMRLSDWLKQ
jgi:hypothetical protein